MVSKCCSLINILLQLLIRNREPSLTGAFDLLLDEIKLNNMRNEGICSQQWLVRTRSLPVLHYHNGSCTEANGPHFPVLISQEALTLRSFMFPLMFIIYISLNTDDFEIFRIVLLGICNSLYFLCPLLDFFFLIYLSSLCAIVSNQLQLL